MKKDRIFRIFETWAGPNSNFYVRSAYVITTSASEAKKAGRENRIINWGKSIRQDVNEYNDTGIKYQHFHIESTYAVDSKYLKKTIEPWMKNPEKPLDFGCGY